MGPYPWPKATPETVYVFEIYPQKGRFQKRTQSLGSGSPPQNHPKTPNLERKLAPKKAFAVAWSKRPGYGDRLFGPKMAQNLGPRLRPHFWPKIRPKKGRYPTRHPRPLLGPAGPKSGRPRLVATPRVPSRHYQPTATAFLTLMTKRCRCSLVAVGHQQAP